MEEPSTVDETVLPGLLARFYDRVRQDDELGPVFNGAVHDWSEHLDRLADFWSSVMLTTGRYKGNPVAVHLRHAPQITPTMFERWLALWERTTGEMLQPDAATAMQAKARRIAESLQLAIRFHAPGHQKPLNAGSPMKTQTSAPYRSTPVFDTEDLPAALRRAHSTKPGVWGVIRVLEGAVRYHVEDGSTPPVLLTPDKPGLVPPEQLHHVEPVGAMRIRIEFYDHKPALAG